MSETRSRTRHKPIVLLNWGLGKHSTAAAVELIENPTRRDFDLDRLILLVAMTGGEWGSQKNLGEDHLLPLLRRHRIRLVQAARNGAHERDGITVLSDTDHPKRLHTEGVYKLSDELRRAGTVPTVCGTRKCSLKFKGWVLNQWIERNLKGEQARQIIGFHAGEMYRVERERRYYAGERPPIEHPLIAWGWDDRACREYLRERFGVEWLWSACSFCMFSNGKPEVIERFSREPEGGAEAVVIERTARIVNPRITLYSRRSVEELLRADGNDEALALADREMERMEWTLMRVQRIRYTKTLVHRRTEELARGTPSEMNARLEREARRRQLPLTNEGGHSRLYLLRAPEPATYPSAEEMIVVAPGTVESKSRANFARRWHELVGQGHLFHPTSQPV